jgi:hypothetical protein
VELLLAAARKGEKDVPLELRDVNFERILWLDATQLVQTSVDERGRTLTVSAREASGAGDWQRHGHARSYVNQFTADRAPRGFVPNDIRELDLDALYARFRRAGHGYGRMFRTLRWAGQAGSDLWGRLVAEPSWARVWSTLESVQSRQSVGLGKAGGRSASITSAMPGLAS